MNMPRKRSQSLIRQDVLIVDDEKDIRELVAGILEDESYETRVAGNSTDALAAIRARRPALIVLDIWLQGSELDGLDLLDVLQEEIPEVPVVMISGHGNVETAVTAIKKGAYDFIEKPFKADHLILTVDRAIEAYRLKKENVALKERYGDEPKLIGTSPAISQVRQNIERVANTGSRVLIVGPAGSGKELVARMIHSNSSRADHSFVAINAAAIAPEKMETTLFGIEGNKDSESKVGLFEEAHRGTLFLDEISDMPLETQNKILRVLVEQRFERVGGGPKVQVDVRVISSSSKDLNREIEAGNLREDLYHRLNVVPIGVPPLSDRREDILELVEYFVDQIGRAQGLTKRKIGDDALAALQSHEWPGNVRELRNNIERLLILSSGDENSVITADMLPQEIGLSTPSLSSSGANERIISLPLKEAREMFEREYLMAQISRFSGNISRTAAFIGMERSALHRKLKSLGLSSNTRNTQPST